MADTENNQRNRNDRGSHRGRRHRGGKGRNANRRNEAQKPEELLELEETGTESARKQKPKKNGQKPQKEPADAGSAPLSGEEKKRTEIIETRFKSTLGDETFDDWKNGSGTSLDDYGLFSDESNEPEVQYDENGVPLPVDFDFYPGNRPAPEPTEEEKAELTEIVGVRFQNSGKSYYFDPQGVKYRQGTHVIVDTARGQEYGLVAYSNRYVKNKEITLPLRPVLRAATREDDLRDEENRRLEEEAFTRCQKKIQEHGLDMKLIEAQYTFDNAKLLFYFSAEGRVDFRDLVKDLASCFHTRIELRQIGIRDETRLLGGLGPCGRPMCCSSFLPDFVQVSIKMAKLQGLSMTMSKMTGCCGKLMCCLRYENDVYEEELAKTPPVDTVVQTADGIGTINSINPLRGTVRVYIRNEKGDSVQKIFPREDVTVLSPEEVAQWREGTLTQVEPAPQPESDSQNPQPEPGATEGGETTEAQAAPESARNAGREAKAGKEGRENREGKEGKEGREGRDRRRSRRDRPRRESQRGDSPEPQRSGTPRDSRSSPSSDIAVAADIPFAATTPAVEDSREEPDGVVRPNRRNYGSSKRGSGHSRRR